MKLHEFCSVGQRRHVLLLTYALQPMFFETVALKLLVDGGADRILVLADQAQIERAINAWPLPQAIGRRWVLGKSTVAGTFHPKLIARIGDSDAQVALLSGNLTSGGWGRNLEVGSGWSVGPSHEDNGGWLGVLITAAQGWTQSPAAQHLLGEMATVPWLQETGTHAQRPRDVVFSNDNIRLIDRLRDRWSGRSFSHARIMTGSTDENGALLQQLHSQFQIKTADIFVTEDRVSFLKKKLKELPLKVRLWAVNDAQVLHAKLVHLSGSGGDVCAWGSANCSAVAWLVPPSGGGNIEIIVLDDKPDVSILDALFGRFLNSKRVYGLDQPRASEHQTAEPVSIRVHGALYDSQKSSIQIKLEISEGVRNLTVCLQTDKGKVRAKLEADADGFYFADVGFANIPEQSLTAIVQGRLGSNEVFSSPFWIDQSVELSRRAIERDAYRQYKKINASVTAFPERLRILSDLMSIADEIMGDRSRITLGARENKIDNNDRAARPLDPSKLVSVIALIPRRVGSSYTHAGGTSIPSLSIFEQLFFDPQEPKDTPTGTRDPDIEEDGERGDIAPPIPQDVTLHAPIEPTKAAIDLESRLTIQAQLNDYVDRLGNAAFLRMADPQRLADAIFVIIATCYKAWHGGWIPAEVAGSTVARLAHVLLFEDIQRHHSILHTYKSQLAAKYQPEFELALGHGKIWSALLAVLAIEPTTSESDSILRASALSLVYRSRDLISRADPANLSALFERSVVAELISKALKVAANVDRTISALSEYVSTQSKRLLSSQDAYLDRAQLFWSPWEGWHRPRQGGVGSVGAAISLKAAVQHDPRVSELVRAVRDAWVNLSSVPENFVSAENVTQASSREHG